MRRREVRRPRTSLCRHLAGVTVACISACAPELAGSGDKLVDARPFEERYLQPPALQTPACYLCPGETLKVEPACTQRALEAEGSGPWLRCQAGIPPRIDADAPLINLVLVGHDAASSQDATTYLPKLSAAVPALNSRADALVLLSLRRPTGPDAESAAASLTVLGVGRDLRAPDSCWRGPGRRSTKGLITELYALRGRAALAPCLRTMMASRFAATDRWMDAEGRFPIHGLIETDFSGFEQAVDLFYAGLSSLPALLLSGEAAGFLSTGRRALEVLRERKETPGGSHGRALKHALFVTTLLGLSARALRANSDAAHGLMRSVLEQPRAKGEGLLLSRSFVAAQLVDPKHPHFVAAPPIELKGKTLDAVSALVLAYPEAPEPGRAALWTGLLGPEQDLLLLKQPSNQLIDRRGQALDPASWRAGLSDSFFGAALGVAARD